MSIQHTHSCAVLVLRDWSEPVSLTMSDGTVINLDIEHDPELTMSGHVSTEVIPWLK